MPEDYRGCGDTHREYSRHNRQIGDANMAVLKQARIIVIGEVTVMRRIVRALVRSREFVVRVLVLTINELFVTRGSRVHTRCGVRACAKEWELDTGRDTDREGAAEAV